MLRTVCGDLESSADVMILAISNLSRCLHTVHHLSLGRHRGSSPLLLPENCFRPGMVYWYDRNDPAQLDRKPSKLTNTTCSVAYTLGIYLLNLFLLFLQPKFDPSLTQDEGLEDGEGEASSLPTKQDDEFRPFIRRLPEFKFWHSATRAILISFVCSWFTMFDIPVFWPVLVMYWIILFVLTSTYYFSTWLGIGVGFFLY